MALLLFTRSTAMKSPERQPSEPRRVDDPRPPVQQQTAEATRKATTPAPFVDPYDMRSDPQPEEPGYGHGV
jgi:hypothetical protein